MTRPSSWDESCRTRWLLHMPYGPLFSLLCMSRLLCSKAQMPSARAMIVATKTRDRGPRESVCHMHTARPRLGAQ
jgi:hypothetical protein